MPLAALEITNDAYVIQVLLKYFSNDGVACGLMVVAEDQCAWFESGCAQNMFICGTGTPVQVAAFAAMDCTAG